MDTIGSTPVGLARVRYKNSVLILITRTVGPHRNKMAKLDSSVVFVEDCTCSDATVKSHFLKLVPYVCVECGCSSHNNKPITLQLDHIDGNHTNCKRENLRLLCPSCHSQTETYAGRQNWNNIVVTDDELETALLKSANISIALKKVKLDVGRTEYFGRATFLIQERKIVVGSKHNTYTNFF